MRPLRAAIAGEVHKLVQSRAASGFDPQAPRGDAGLFGPGSIAWRVHGDFTTMMVGGVSALLLQMLHPGALAGVWDHSNFREDMAGRLRRTASFIAGTTYGSTVQAEALIAHVRAIHDNVHGTLPDGRSYSANDPELLTWVHVGGNWCFLQSYIQHRGRLTRSDSDRYFAETAAIAYRLGAVEVPTSAAAAERYLIAMRPALRADARTRAVARALLTQPAPSLILEPFRRLVMRAGIDLLPDWATRLHGFRRARHQRTTDAAVRTVRRVTAWALAPA